MTRARLVLMLALAAPGGAAAYPQFQFQTDAVRCNQCHYAPAGGGLINGYGREQAGDEISLAGNGSFLHGLWTPPSWLALGGDIRLAGLINDVGATYGAEYGAFPMQADLYSRFAFGPVSVYLNLGFRGAPRPSSPTLLSRFVSREHYVMYRPDGAKWYVRAGRFFAPYGLRVAEHPTYIRRFLGFNTLEETYNLSGGWVDDDWELHVTAFTADFLRPVGYAESGGAAYFEKRFGKAAAGAQLRFGTGEVDSRFQGGLIGKYFIEEPGILLLAQVDLVAQSLKDADASRVQMVGYLGASTFVTRGLLVQVMLERFDEDMAVRGVARTAAAASLQWFFHAHLEASLYGRVQLIGTGSDDGRPSGLLILQLHYYL